MIPKILRCAPLLAAAALAIPGTILAQTPDSVIAASSGGVSLFRVNVDAGTIFSGSYGTGSVPAEGSGTRMMWYPGKAAFRAGYINGTQWDDANIGNYSVAIGQNVRASGDNAVAFGLRSTAANTSSFAVGEDNTATGFASVAMGYHAHTNSRRGSFVFADNVTGGSQDSVRAELVGQAVWRLSCGMRIYTSHALDSGVAFGGPTVNPSVCGTGTYFGQGNAMISTSTGAYLSTSGIWTNSSDVNRKHRFLAVSGEDVLHRLRALPISSWSYRVDSNGVRHLGPMAQDFRAAFGLGQDSTTIATVDADGVALAAAQAIDRANQRQQAEIDALRSENAGLRARLERLEALIAPKEKTRP